jgi:hypothetical protein
MRLSGAKLAWLPVLKSLTVVLLLVCAGAAGLASTEASTGPLPPSAEPPNAPCPRPVDFERDDFPRRPRIDNRWLPLVPGTQLTLEGRANRGGGPLPHTVTFTVTDLTKVIAGVRTRVAWDVDVNEGEVAERELAFFAQDDDGNVWNLGEYPEEFEDGHFLGAPNTWIAGLRDAEGGIHMLNRPRVGQDWLQGFAPEIDFLDCATVVSKSEQVCVPVSCYDRALLTHERSPLDLESGIQTKYHAPGVGIVQVGAVDDPEGETLVLTNLTRLDPEALAVASNEALKLDERGRIVSEVYGQAPPARAPPGARLPSEALTEGAGSPAPEQAAAGRTQGEPTRGAVKSARRYTPKVDHPLVPLTSVRRTEFRGREGDTRIRVVSRVLDKTRRVAGVRVAIVDVREFEDGELVEHTRDYFAQDGKGNVWYFGERVDDVEDGKVVGHEGQWFAGKHGAKPGLFMPVKPKVGQRFAQERAPGVAEDRSRVVAVGLEVTVRAGQFDECIRTRDYAPLDRSVEFKFYCADVGLVREKAKNTRVDLVRYR